AIGYLRQPVVGVNTGPRRSEQDHGEDDHPHAGLSSPLEDDGVLSPIMSCHASPASAVPAAATASPAPVSGAAGRCSVPRRGVGVGQGCPCPPPAVASGTLPPSARKP